jgi:hypothetical protein
MSDGATPRLTVTVRTRLGQVLDLPLGAEESAEVHAALLQMLEALFGLDRPENVRSVTFEVERPSP